MGIAQLSNYRPVEMPQVDGGDGGGDDGDMEARVSKLEAIVPTLATKIDLAVLRTDMADLRTEMHKEFNAQTWRIIGAMITFGTLLSAAVFYIARNVH